MRIGIYAALDAALTRTLAACSALHQGLWLGLLDAAHLDEAGQRQYTRWAKYSDDAYNLSGLNPWEDSALADIFAPGSTVLLAAAGGGREAVALAQRGYQVAAFDSTPALVDECQRLLRQLGLPGSACHAHPGQVPAALPEYDGAIIGWGGYMHIPGRAKRIAFLKAVRQRLANGGPILLSFFTREDDGRSVRWIHAIASFLRKLRRSADPVELGDGLAGTFDHYFTESEIRAELEQAGFELLEYRRSPYGHALGRAR